MQFNDTQAISEGWCISEMSIPFHADESFQLEAVYNPEIGPTIFNSDDEAVAFVVAQAVDGSAYHQTALKHLAEVSPRELINFPAIADAIAA